MTSIYRLYVYMRSLQSLLFILGCGFLKDVCQTKFKIHIGDPGTLLTCTLSGSSLVFCLKDLDQKPMQVLCEIHLILMKSVDFDSEICRFRF